MKIISRLCILIMISLALSSCVSSQAYDYSYPSGINYNLGLMFQEPIPATVKVTPASFEEEKSKVIVPATWTTHDGILQDPIPIGEYGEWGIYHENRFLNERTDYSIRMNVNYAVRGNLVLDLYNAYTREMEDIEAATSSYYFDDYERYIPKPGNELILINITIEVDSDENKPLSLKPQDFDIASSAGIRYSSGKNYDWDNFEYLNLIDYAVYPGGKATGNLIYEVPKNQEVLLGFVGVWFKTE